VCEHDIAVRLSIFAQIRVYNAAAEVLAESVDANAPVEQFTCAAPGPLWVQVCPRDRRATSPQRLIAIDRLVILQE
jgi:hypothetical protein